MAIFRKKRSAEFLGTDEAAAYLGMSRPRLRQLVAEQQIDAQVLSDRVVVYPVEELQRLAVARRGESVTPVAALLEAPAQPLERTHDQVVRIQRRRSLTAPPMLVHCRVWQGPDAAGKWRIVVLTSAADGYSGAVAQSWWETIATEIDIQLLGGRGVEAVWFTLYLENDDHWSELTVDNIVQYPKKETRKLRGPDPLASPADRFQGPSWRSSSMAELRRLTGAGPIEIYPAKLSTEAMIEDWRRSGEVVLAVDDRAQVGNMLGAIRVFDQVRLADPRHELARGAAAVLAREITSRLALVDVGSWNDGTPRKYDGQPFTDGRDIVMAARLMPRSLTAAEQLLVTAHNPAEPEKWPWEGSYRRSQEKLLRDLRRWLEDIDQYADPQSRNANQEDALRLVGGVLAFWVDLLEEEDRRALGEDALPPDTYYPRFMLKTFMAHGDADRAYLESLTPAGLVPASREFRMIQPEIESWMRTFEQNGTIRYGYDRSGRLVGTGEIKPHDPRGDFAVVVTCWPHDRPERGLPDDAVLIADGDTGDRPVYIRYADGMMTLLPSLPGSLDGWNFGYGGGGPAALVAAITRAYAIDRRTPLRRVPARWIQDTVSHAPQDRLQLSIGDITRRATS